MRLVSRAPLLLLLVPLLVALTLAACGDDDDGGDEVNLLPEGEYPAVVSGNIEFSLPEEAVSALAFGPVRNTAELSGTATISMGADGSFEIPEWGVTGTFTQEAGQPQTIQMQQATSEPSTGVTTADGTTADLYSDITLSGTTTGANSDTMEMTGDPLLDTTDSFTLNLNNPPIELATSEQVPVATVYAFSIIFDISPDLDGDSDGAASPEPEPDQVAEETPPADGDGPPTVLVDEFTGCEHTQPGIESVLRKLVVVLLLGGLQNRNQDPAQPDLLVLVTDEGSLPAMRQDPALGQGTPLEGATVTVTASGPAVVPGEETQQEVTDANGEARAEFRITAFGPYQLTVGSVAAPDGTLYQFDPASNLTETFEVGQTCENPEGW
jgi:hypothetical protein